MTGLSMVETGGLAANEKATWNASREAQRSTSNTTLLLAGILLFAGDRSEARGLRSVRWAAKGTSISLLKEARWWRIQRRRSLILEGNRASNFG